MPRSMQENQDPTHRRAADPGFPNPPLFRLFPLCLCAVTSTFSHEVKVLSWEIVPQTPLIEPPPSGKSRPIYAVPRRAPSPGSGLLGWWFSSPESVCQCWRCRFHPWVRKIPWRRKWQSTPVFLSGKSHGQKSLAGYNPGGPQGSDRTQLLNELMINNIS